MELFIWLGVASAAVIGMLALFEYDKYALAVGAFGGALLASSRVLTLGANEGAALSDFIFSPAWREILSEESPPIRLGWMLSPAPVLIYIGYGLLALAAVMLLGQWFVECIRRRITTPKPNGTPPFEYREWD